MKIGLVDVDGKNFPNLALMRISAFHKALGDQVEWWRGDLMHYDKVYKSKIFSFTKDIDVQNASEVIQGGTGYEINLVNGKEIYTKSRDLPEEIEQCKPDYTIYPQYDFAIAMTTRGCPRGCEFCVVGKKEGRCSRKVANVADFYQGQKRIEVLDPNITACIDRFDLYEQYKETGAQIVFNQGLDIRLITDKDVEYLNSMRIKELHFAWDNANENLAPCFKSFAERYSRKNRGTVYVLTNFNSTMEENLYRINTLWDMGFYPYVMVYDKAHAPKEIRKLQRWCNNRFIFKSCKWEEYQ